MASELAENWKKRLSEHKSRVAGSKSAVNEHVTRSKNTHQIDWDIINVLEKEPIKDFPRKVLEAIHIRKKGPNLNRDKGLDLDPVWDNLIKPTIRPGWRELNISHLCHHSKLWCHTGCSLANSENYIRAYKTSWGRGWYSENVSGKQNLKVVLRFKPINSVINMFRYCKDIAIMLQVLVARGSIYLMARLGCFVGCL